METFDLYEQHISHCVAYLFSYKGDLHLVGCTNSGKSTLFNSLLMSDLCRNNARGLISRATTSIWPGMDSMTCLSVIFNM